MNSLELIAINELILSEKNPRTISKEEMSRLCKSINEDPDFLFARPVLVNMLEDGSYHVYAGNQRVRAAKMLGWDKISCLVEVELPEKVMNDRLLKDNLHSGEWDFDELANCFDIDNLLDLGFNASDFDIGIDLGSNSDEEKKKKSKLCPECGHEF